MSGFSFRPQRQREKAEETRETRERQRSVAGRSQVHDRIVASLEAWVAHHPNPDAPALSLGGLGDYSPRELYWAVADETEAGSFFEAMIVNGAQTSERGLDGVLQSFENESGPGGYAKRQIWRE